MPETLTLTVITPEAVSVDKPVVAVTLPAHDGELGILPGHAPLITRLGCGVLQAREANGTTVTLHLEGGVAQIATNTVTVLTLFAAPPEKLDSQATSRELEQQVQMASTLVDGKLPPLEVREHRSAEVNRLRARLRSANRRTTRP